MSRHGDVSFLWGGEERSFRLSIGELIKLQERTDAGPFELFKRLSLGTWRVADVREAVRLGLVGGGAILTPSGAIDDAEIARLVRDYVDERPLLQSVTAAVRILDAALNGAPDEQIPKSQAAEQGSRSSRMESSASPSSMVGGRNSTARPKKSEDSRSGSSTPRSRAGKRRTGSPKSRQRPALQSSPT